MRAEEGAAVEETEAPMVGQATSRQAASRTGTRDNSMQSAVAEVIPAQKEKPAAALPTKLPSEEKAEPPAVLQEKEEQPAELEPKQQDKTETADPAVTYISHTVASGDTFWNLSIKYGIPMAELLAVNKMTEKTPLSIGMQLKIPVYHIPVVPTLGAQYGELLDWWTQAQYVWPIGKDARVIDFATGKSFMARRTIGAFHADVEPLTAHDTQLMKEVWGAWSWATRPVIVEVDGRRIAASASAMPHDIQFITDNNFEGHFDIHFLNSTRHKDNLQQADHQRNVRTAAGQ
ncbi:MAG: LysM peptidoglycan-binding domain-containing protein [Dethiobacter sp.]|nr:LysM peptidoglycan-binding domain-containing protein [Dethiobacter sp.]